MSFGELLTHPQVWPFSLALLLFFAAALLEIIMVFTGAGMDLGLDLSVDIDVPDVSVGWRVFDWLGIGRVPYLITLMAFLLCVGLLGLFAQTLQLEMIGVALPWPVVLPAVIVGSLPPVRLLNFALGRVWPKDVESSAVTAESLVGHEAEVVLGRISATEPGQIKFRDSEGATHHRMAYADRPDDVYEQGDILLIVGRRGAFFTVIQHPNPSRASNSSARP
jgi:hypothetical protein